MGDSSHADFARWVRDALRHLHDPVYLQTHHLARLLTGAGTGQPRTAQRLRQLLLDAIGTLQPEHDPADARASRRYELLTLRYVEALEIDDVVARLGISRREYNREHRQALDAVVSLLEGRVSENRVSATPSAHTIASGMSEVTARLTSVKPLPLPANSFIGREREVQEVLRLIESARLVTLGGAPGTGKTRLALQVGLELASSSGEESTCFPDGISFVPLASISEPAQVVFAIAQALGARELPGRSLIESLEDHLGQRDTLLILDNFEHVLEAAPVVSGLLTACPRLKVLVTSRALLRLSGEHEFVVPHLELPEISRQVPFEQIERYEAVRLYVDRARAVDSTFRLTQENAPEVVEICRRLDCLPLAIELAAARVRLFPPQTLLRRLRGGGSGDPQRSTLELLSRGARDAPARQQTLRSAIDWSFRLLTPAEQHLLARLSVFAGGWTLGAAEAVCRIEGELDIVEEIASLVDKSLVQRVGLTEGDPRFSLLETLREYAREQLESLGEEARTVRRQQAEHYLALAREADRNMLGREQVLWKGRLSHELDNIRAALSWSRDNGEVELALQLGSALQWFWFDGGHWAEGLTWLESALALSAPEARTEGRAAALAALGGYNRGLSNFAAGRTLLEESLGIWRELGDRRGTARALVELAVILAAQGESAAARCLTEEGLCLARLAGDRGYVALALHSLGLLAIQDDDEETARARIEESQRVWRELDNRGLLSMATNSLGDLARSRGRYAEAEAYYRESLELAKGSAPRLLRAGYLHNLGHVVHRQGNDWEARELFTEALSLFRELGDRRGVAECVAGLAGLTVEEWPQRTARLFGAATAGADATGSRLSSTNRAEYDRTLAAARAGLGEEAFSQALAEGQAMTLDEAVEYALRHEAGT